MSASAKAPLNAESQEVRATHSAGEGGSDSFVQWVVGVMLLLGLLLLVSNKSFELNWAEY